jgi:putative transposase
MTQIWIALCVYLMLAYLKHLSAIGASLQQMIRLLQLNLFSRRDLIALLHAEPPDPPPPHPQAQLAFA